ETVMTGLLGGGHAIHYDAKTDSAWNLDCFVTVPSGSGEAMEHLPVPFGEQIVEYAVGAASCGVPGLPAGLDALSRRHGRLPWAELVEPALRLARTGVPMPAAHATCLAMLAPVMTMREGAAIYAPGGELLREGDLLEQPGLVHALELLRDEGCASVYTGTIAERLLELSSERGGVLTRDDLLGYVARWRQPVECSFSGRRLATRGGLSGMPETIGVLDPSAGDEGLLAALEHGPRSGGSHTTNIAAVDAEGNA